MPASSRPLAALLLAAALLAASAISPAAAADTTHLGGGRMVIIRRAPPAGKMSAAGDRSSSRWQRRLEDEVAPEFGGMLAANGNFVSSGALIANKAVCIHNCGGNGGRPYTRPCGNIYHSRGC